MQKKIILTGLCVLSILAFGACGESNVNSGSVNGCETHTYVKQDAVSATCETAGNETYYTCEDCDAIFDAGQKEISAIPTVAALGHVYALVTETTGTCSEKGKLAHYTCDACEKLFDLTKEEIASIEGDYDTANHTSETLITVQTQPSKVTYKAGEAFDPTGLTVVYKCAACEGEILDNQFLTYTYQREGADTFADGDTKITVNFNELSFDVAVTVAKEQTQIFGVEEEYTTVCGVAPEIAATSNLPDSDIVIQYYDGEQEVSAADMLAGKTYTAKISIAETDAALGAEKTATVKVEHRYDWQADVENVNKLVYKCNCDNAKEYYVMNNQEIYVDGTDMSIDLSKLVIGTSDYSVKSVQQIQLLNENAKVDIDGENAGMVYTFAQEKYEKLTEEWTPYFLVLSVVYTVEGVDCEVTFTAKYVEKVIRNAEDLLSLAYTGADTAENGGVAVTGQYVLVNDIDASGLTLAASNHAWQAKIGFQGVFEGNGYTISNLTVPAWTNGLFGALGYNGKIQNVNFDNVTVGEGGNLFALVIRNAFITNVNVNFNVNSTSYAIADSANDCEFSNVSVLTEKGKNPFKIQENAENPMPETITLNYFTQYTVSFDTDGGSEVAPVAVTAGKTVTQPAAPTKESAEYNYVFLGWYIGETAWDFTTVITEDITLVAKWEQKEKESAEDVIAKIAVLPDSVTMPDNVYFVTRILEAKAAYDELSTEIQAQVTNYSKLQSLLTNIRGYETVYVQSVSGANVIPSHVPNYTSTIGGTASVDSDELYGNYLRVTPNAGGKVAVQFIDFPDVSGYTKIYFNIRVVGASCDIYLSDGIVNDGWGANWKNTWSMEGFWINSGNWITKEVNVSTGIFSSDWALGLRTNTTDVYFEITDIVGYADTTGTATGLTFGNFVDTGTTNEYGKVYNFTQGWASDKDMGAFNVNALSGALINGANTLHFWIYNPNDSAVDFSFSGDMNAWNPQGAYVTTLAAKAWTEVVITPEIIVQGNSGTWFVGVTTGAGTAGWQISSIYAVKA